MLNEFETQRIFVVTKTGNSSLKKSMLRTGYTKFVHNELGHEIDLLYCG